MHELIATFAEKIKAGSVEIYNEFSLQHELGIFLRENYIPSVERKVQFERNVSSFDLQKNNFIKREIDITIFNDSHTRLEAIELKYPRNGQYPEQMFSFCKDIVFLEQLILQGFTKASFLLFADETPFYDGKSEGIYRFFRGDSPAPLTGIIRKPTGKKNEELEIKGTYNVRWHNVKDKLKYAFIEVVPK